MNWIIKNSSAIMILVMIAGWVWSLAVMWTKLKQLFKQHEDAVEKHEELEKDLRAHANSTLVHVDPVRDERRLQTMERMLQDLHTGLLSKGRIPKSGGG